MEQQTLVNWRKPEEVPGIGKYEYQQFWIAVEKEIPVKDMPACKVVREVIPAYYVNKPLEYDGEELIDQNPFVDNTGEPIEIVGWCIRTERPGHDPMFDKIKFCKFNYRLVGWADYITPEFGVNAADAVNESERAFGVAEFAGVLRGAYCSGFIDNNPTVYDVFRSAQNHIKDNYGICVDNWDDAEAKESRKGNAKQLLDKLNDDLHSLLLSGLDDKAKVESLKCIFDNTQE